MSALKLTAYFQERDRAAAAPGLLADRLLDLYADYGVRVGVLLRGSGGFGAMHRLHTDRRLTLSEDLPVVATALDTRERIEALLPRVLELQRGGLLTLERARLLDGVGDLPSGSDEEIKLTAFVGRHERVGGRPAQVELTELLWRAGVAGATVLSGVDGVRDGRRQRARLLGRNGDVPAMVIAVGGAAHIAAALARLRGLWRSGPPLLALERVRVCRRDGLALADPHELPAVDESGLPLWQRLTVYGSAAHPDTDLLVRRLLSIGAAGATSVRGSWGFHGGHPPHGDRLLQVRRRAPVVTTVLEAPDRIGDALEVVQQITRDRGLVISEMVPALLLAGRGGDSGRGPTLARHPS